MDSSLRTAAKQALKFCEFLWHEVVLNDWAEGQREAAEAALRAALAEDAMQKFTEVNQELEAALAEPVPVAWYHVPYPNNGAAPMVSLSQQREPSMYGATVPLYLAPPQRKPLTEEEILAIVKVAPALDTAEAEWLHVARAIERAHNIKE